MESPEKQQIRIINLSSTSFYLIKLIHSPSENDVYISNAVRLDLRLASNQQTKTESSINLEENILKSEYKTNLNKSNKRMMQPTNTVSSLVSSFLNKEKKTVQIPKVGTILPIEEFFIEINGKDINDFDY